MSTEGVPMAGGGTPHIVVVEDDPDIRELIVEALKRHGHRVSEAADSRSMRRIVAQIPANVVLVDLGLPDEDGMLIAREIREQSDAGVIIVTGRGGEIDRVLGLELGADDYIVKPFLPRELVARVQVVLRRSGKATFPAAEGHGSKGLTRFEFDGWILDVETRSVTSAQGGPIELTTAEFELLRIFLQVPAQPHSRQYLSQQVFRRDWSPYDRAVDGLVSRLRRKLTEAGLPQERIKTMRGSGYIWAGKVG